MAGRLSEQQKDRARVMRQNGYSFKTIAGRIGSTYVTVRCLLDPDYKARKRGIDADRRWSRTKATTSGVRQYPRTVHVPSSVEIDRDARCTVPRTLTASIFGDPPPGYSALDHKNNGMKTR